MSADPSPPEARRDCGWVKLYHTSGVLVTLPVLPGLDYPGMFAAVSAAVAAGFAVEQPGLDEGETKVMIDRVVRKEKENNDNTTTPVIDLYEPDNKFATLSVYLNREEDVDLFQRVSGLRLSDLPVYIGANKIEVGASKQTDRFVAKAPKHFGAVWKKNPKYDPNETDTKKKKASRLFVRWAEVPPAPKPLIPEEQEAAVTKWFDWLAHPTHAPTRDELNKALPGLSQLDPPRKRQVWDRIAAFVQPNNWVFNPQTKVYEEDRRPVTSGAGDGGYPF